METDASLDMYLAIPVEKGLGIYFYEKQTKWERQNWEERFVSFGRRTLIALGTKKLSPKEAPAYIVQYYGAHLERIESPPEALLPLVSYSWAQAWEELEGSHVGFLNDVNRSWRTAEQADHLAINSGQQPSHIGTCIRCAMCYASIHSLAANIPPTLLQSLVEKGIWSPDQGLAYARQVSNPQQRAEALTSLFSHLPDSLLHEALEIAWRIEKRSARVETLVRLIPHLKLERLKGDMLHQVLQATEDIKNEFSKAKALKELSPYLSGRLLQKALQIAHAIEDPFSRTEALGGLAPFLPDEWKVKVWNDSLQSAHLIEDKSDQMESLIELISHLPAPLKTKGAEEALHIAEEALHIVQRVEDKIDQIEALAELLPSLPDQLKEREVEKALPVVKSIKRKFDRMEALVKFLPSLPAQLKEQEVEEALQAVRTMKRRNHRVEGFRKLIPYLSENHKEKILHE